MQNRDLNNTIACITSVPPLLRTATITPSVGVDLVGFDRAAVVVVVGALTDGTHTVSIEESDSSGSGFAAVAAAQLSGTPGAVAANTVYEYGYLGTKRYIRAVVTVTGSPSTGANIAAIVVKAGAKTLPA
jgi:hypothetical protein